MTHESTAAWSELLETLGGLDRSFLEGDRAVSDDRHISDGYRMLATTLGVALDTYLFAEPSRPMFVEVNTPFRRDRRWGGDNTDAYYHMCPVDPKRRYRISGNKGDSVYFSVTAYNEPSPGAWSDRIDALRARTLIGTGRADEGKALLAAATERLRQDNTPGWLLDSLLRAPE